MSTHRPRYRLTLEALPSPDGPSADRRLAQVLKGLLRQHKFRCVEAEEVTPKAEEEVTIDPERRQEHDDADGVI